MSGKPTPGAARPTIGNRPTPATQPAQNPGQQTPSQQTPGPGGANQGGADDAPTTQANEEVESRANFTQRGNFWDYTPGTDVAAGTVVALTPTFFGIADNDIPANTLGALRVNGTYQLPSDGNAFAQGVRVAWDGTQIIADNATNTIGRIAWPVESGDAIALVSINV